MLKTIVMDGSWKQIKINRLGVDLDNMEDELTPEDNANKIADSYGQLKAGVCIATDPNNGDLVFIAEWENADPEDCVSLGVGGYMERPRSDVKALNELWVMGTSGDKVYVQAL